MKQRLCLKEMKTNLIKSLQAGPACPTPCMFGETEPKASPKANAGGYSWSTCHSQSKVHVVSPEASASGSVPLCTLLYLGHKGEPLTFAVYRARPGTSLNAALDSIGVFSKHPGSCGGLVPCGQHMELWGCTRALQPFCAFSLVTTWDSRGF